MSRLNNTLTFTATLVVVVFSVLLYNSNSSSQQQQQESVSLLSLFSFSSLGIATASISKDSPGSILSQVFAKISTPQQQQQQQQQQTAAQMSSAIPRTIRKVFLAAETAEGVGATVRRSIGTPHLRNFTPFLMLDHFSIKPGAGFPDHPHRGQETITYLLNGGVDHEDFAGNKGTINSGDLQFMTAGKGVMHAEMPHMNADGSANVGLQLWVDLPKELKSCETRYRDLRAAEIPAVNVDSDRVTVKVISGQSHGVDSVKDLAYTPVWLLDVTVRPGGKITQPLPAGWNAFAYVLAGSATFGKEGAADRQKVDQFHNVVFNQEGDEVDVEVAADSTEEARLVLVAGMPLDQEIVQYGPFVVTSKEEVYQALMDYQTHSNGFERAKDWKSEIGKSMAH